MKRFCVAIAAALMIAANTCSVALAQGPSGGALVPGEVILSDEESMARIKNSDMPEAEKAKVLEKYNFKSKRENFYNTHLGMKQFKQINEYYCGPATAYQTLYSINGWSDSQSILGEAMQTTIDGTIGNLLIQAINDRQDKNTYVTHLVKSQETFRHCINVDMQYNVPAILRIRFDSSTEFGYDVDGHYVNVGGQNTGASKYVIVDPYYGYPKGPKEPVYFVSDSTAYKATTTHPAKQLYY